LESSYSYRKELLFLSTFFHNPLYLKLLLTAQHRIQYFIQKLQSDENVWKKFETFYELNQEIQLEDIPSLEPLITEVFIEKELPLDT